MSLVWHHKYKYDIFPVGELGLRLSDKHLFFNQVLESKIWIITSWKLSKFGVVDP